MKLLFLGTSSAWPLPRLGCDCHLCSSTDSRDHRLRPALLVNDEILIDAPPDIYHQLNKWKVDNGQLTIKYILLTHSHPDHIMGLFDLSHLYNQEKPKIVAPQEVINGTRKLHQWPLTANFEVKSATPGQAFPLNKQVQVTYVSVVHGRHPTFGVKIKADRLLFYAPEFNQIHSGERKFVRGVNLAVLDGSSLSKAGKTPGHETIEEGIRMGKNLKAKKVYFTNIGHKTGRFEELEAFVQEKGDSQFYIAYDGLKLEI